MGKVGTTSLRRAHSGELASGLWKAPSLTASERAYMICKAKEASVALVDHAHTLDGPVQWHYTGKFRGIQMYRGEGSYERAGTAGTEYLCGVTTMMGSIEEVASYFDQQTTEHMLARKADDVLDCGVLYSLVRGAPNNPFYRVSAKYQLFEGPSAFSRERDYCYLECQNTFRHASGRRGWVLSMHSIKLPSYPELEGVVRGSMYQSGYVFVEAERKGYMDVMHSLQINFKSTKRLPYFLLNAALKRRIVSVVTISREIQSTRMGRQTILNRKQLMPKRSRILCGNCSRKFSLFVRKTRCRVCGEVVCQPCAPQVSISAEQGSSKTRVCIKCYHSSLGDEYEQIEALPKSHIGGKGNIRPMRNDTRYSDILHNRRGHPNIYREEEEDSLEEDGDEDGLEEQSDYSVFAQSRFTEASHDSFATSQFSASNSHFEGSSQFDATSELDYSQYYDGDSSENSFVSGTSTSRWIGSNSASSRKRRGQARSERPTDSFMYDPQASTTSSSYYGTHSYKSGYGGSKHMSDNESDKRSGRYKATEPIPEDEPSSYRGYNISPGTSYESSAEMSSTQATNDISSEKSNVKTTQGTEHDSSVASQNLDTKHTGKTVSIQGLAKGHSARYGIKSHFPQPPPPPLFSPVEEHDKGDENHSPLHLEALKPDNHQNSKDRKAKNTGARNKSTPPPPKDGHRGADQTAAKRASNVDFQASLASSKGSTGFSSTQSSAILEQMRRNRDRTLQSAPGSSRTSAVLKSMEEEHLARMRELHRIQEKVREKAARRSMASNRSRPSTRSAQNGPNACLQTDRSSSTAAGKKREQPQRSSRRTPAESPSSPNVPPPGSPPGTPPSMRGRLPNSTFSNRQLDSSLVGNYSQRTNTSSDFEGNRVVSSRSNAAVGRSSGRASLAPSPVLSKDLVSNSQRRGIRASKDNDLFSNGRRLDSARGTSKESRSSLDGRRLDASRASKLRHPDDLAFDASRLSLDKSRFSSRVAIQEIPMESPSHVAMMGRPSTQSSSDSLLNEDLLNKSLAGMSEHISSIRAREAHKILGKENSAGELQRRQEEHRKRMEELAKLAANHVGDFDCRDSSSTLGGLNDSSIDSGNHLGNSTTIAASFTSSDDIDDDEFNFESRPLGRTKRSGTIPFALDEAEQIPDVEEDEEQSEGLNDSEINEEHDNNSDQGYGSYSSEGPALTNAQVSHPEYRFSEEFVENKCGHEDRPSYCPSEEFVKSEHEDASGLVTPPRRSSVGTFEDEHIQTGGVATSPFRPSVESEESEHQRASDSATLPRRSSVEESVESGNEQETGSATSSLRPSEEYATYTPEQKSNSVTSPCLTGEESAEPDHEQGSGVATPRHRSSTGSVENDRKQNTGLATPPRRSSVESEESADEKASLRESVEFEAADYEQERDSTTSSRYPSMEAVESEHDCTNEFATSSGRQSVESAENERGHESESDSARSSCSSIVEPMEQRECDNDMDDMPDRSRDQSMDEHMSDDEDAEPAYRPSEESVKHECDAEHVESTHRSSDESELEYAAAMPNHPNDELASPVTSASNFLPHSSQLIPGEGGAAVDEFFADTSLASSGKLSQVDEADDDDTRSPRDTSKLHQKHLDLANSINEEYNSAKMSRSNISSTGMSKHVSSFHESSVSAIDEELMNRPTNELFDMIRANRLTYSSSGSCSSDMMHDLEASHLRRMEELNRIAVDYLGNRISNLDDDMLGSAFQPGRSLYPGFRGETKEVQWRSSGIMEEVYSRHEVDMERLRRRIRQLEEECRESIASVLAAEEMDLSEFDDDDDSDSGHPRHSSFLARSDLSSSTISEHGMDASTQFEEHLPAHVLFEQIAQLTRLQRVMAEAEDDDEDEYRERIKEQYRVLRSIKANSHHERESLSRQDRESLSRQDRESVSEDEENWI